MQKLVNYLRGNAYPGRGILIGRLNGKMVIAYFIMGRSENSRNRVFVRDGDDLRTKAFDEGKLIDPSLIIYYPVKTLTGVTVVTNGDQTDTICSYLARGMTFEEALATREFEPDGPNWTPRISGIVYPDGGYKLSILKADSVKDPACIRYFYEYRQPKEGTARLIHTYKTDGEPIPSFEGEPARFEIGGDIDEFSQNIWNALDENNKVSLYVRYISPDGSFEDRIINKNK